MWQAVTKIRFQRLLTMVYNSQNCWVSVPCPSSGILENTTFRKLDLFLSSGEGETPTLLGPLERANLNHWTNTGWWTKSKNPVILSDNDICKIRGFTNVSGLLWLRAGRPRSRSLSPAMVKNFLISAVSRLAPWSTQSPVQWVLAAISSGAKRPGRESAYSHPFGRDLLPFLHIFMA
jgi:hypothetical protein